MRRTLTIIAAAIVLLGLLALAYFFFFAGQEPALTPSDTQNPFGTPAGDTPISDLGGGTDTTPTSGDNTPTVVSPKLVEITAGPVAKGFNVQNTLGSTDATTTPTFPDTEVRYVKRDSGNLYSYMRSAGRITRLSNKTIPGVQEASWLPDGSIAFLRYLSIDQDKSQHIETYALPASGNPGYFLERDLSEVLTIGSTTLFTLLPSTDGSVGALSAYDGTNVRTLFSSQLSQITVLFAGPGVAVAETKPSYDSRGYVFLLNTTTGGMTELIGPTTGLEALPSPSGKEVLLSSVDTGGMHLAVIDVTSHVVTNLPVATFAEKCVWTPDSTAVYCGVPNAAPAGTLPDDWFQGAVFLTDRIWKIDLTARVATLVADLPTLTGTPIDAVSLTLDPRAQLLVFMNNRDDSLWAYSL